MSQNLVNGKGDGIVDPAAFRTALDVPSNAEAEAVVTPAATLSALEGMTEGQKTEARAAAGVNSDEYISRVATSLDTSDAMRTGVNVSPGRYVRNIAMSGDSHLAMITTTGTTQRIPEVFWGIEAYGGTFLRVVRPASRDRFYHAIGGSTVSKYIDGHQPSFGGPWSQRDEVLALITAGEVDTVLVSLGTNDYSEAGFDVDVAFGRYRTEIIDQYTAAGAIVVVCAIPPKQDSGTTVAQATEWNTRLHSEFGELPNVIVIDAAKMLGGQDGELYRVRDDVGSDGTHLSSNAQILVGRLYCSILRKFTNPYADPIHVTEWISTNPYNLASGTGHDGTFWGTGTTSSTPNRGDGETDERTRILGPWMVTNTIGSTNRGLVYTATADSIARKLSVVIDQSVKTSASTVEIEVNVHGRSRVCKIRMPGTSATAPTVTAIDVKTAWDANAEALALATCAYVTDGTGLAFYGKGITSPQLRCHAAATADALAVSDGDVLRAYAEIWPVDDSSFSAVILDNELWSNAGVSGVMAKGMEATFYPSTPLPSPLDGLPLLVTSPWVESSGGRTQFRASIYFVGNCRYRIARFGVQRKIE